MPVESFRTNRSAGAPAPTQAEPVGSLEAVQAGSKDFAPVPKKRLKFECTKVEAASPSDYAPEVAQCRLEWEIPADLRKGIVAPDGFEQSFRVTQFASLKTGIPGKRSTLFNLIAATVPVEAEPLLDAWTAAGGPLDASWLYGLTIEAQVDHKERPNRAVFAYFKTLLAPDGDDPVAQEQLEIIRGYMRAKNPAIYARITGDTGGPVASPVARPSRNSTSPELPV